MGLIDTEKIKRFVDRTRAYKRVFVNDNADVKAVLADLGRFAPVDPTAKVAKPFNKNSNEVYMMIGRRQVVDYILGKINMTDRELSNLIKQERLNQEQGIKM